MVKFGRTMGMNALLHGRHYYMNKANSPHKKKQKSNYHVLGGSIVRIAGYNLSVISSIHQLN